MKKLLLYISLFTYILINHSYALAESPANAVKEGNTFYQQGEYDEAVRMYQEAKEMSPDSDIVNFNLGAALFQKGEFQESAEAFTRSMITENPDLEADAAYNIANAKYKLGSATVESDMNGAAKLYQETLDYYKRAIELDEKNTDAKHNFEIVDKELKILLEKIKNQPKQEQEDKKEQKEKEKEENQKEQENQDKQESEQSESEEDKEKKEAQQEEENKQENQEGKDEKEGAKDQADNQESGQEDANAPGEEEAGEMSPEEARMLLDAFAEEEAMDNLQKSKKGYNSRVLKDW